MDLPLDRNRLHPPYMKQGRLVRNTLSLEQTMVDIFQEIMSFKRQGMWFTYELVGFSHSYMDAASIGHIRILGIGLELACNGSSCGGISLTRVEYNLYWKRLPRISLTCKVVAVQYREYEYGLLSVVKPNPT